MLARLVEAGYACRHIWQAVIAKQAAFPAPFPVAATSWQERVQWIRDNTEEYARLEYGVGAELERSGHKHLVLFDALDRLADSWPTIRPLARALFQVALDTLANRGLRLKLFVRPDMLADREILAFPDSSKLKARRASLTWRRVDLYALLFQCLGNDKQHGEMFRTHCLENFQAPWLGIEGGWALPDSLRRDERLQQAVFDAIAGPHMAADPHGHKKGFPYSWLPNHLIDGHGQVSPRSFFAALWRASAEPTASDWRYALHFNQIKLGVQEASKIRVAELSQEDYPWVAPLMEPLRGQSVPCAADEVLALWRRANTLERVSRIPSENVEVRLLPPHFEDGPKAMLKDLEDLGIIEFLRDGRTQMPDVYRVAFGLGRKGGVKPLQ